MGLIEQKLGELLKLERERRQLTLESISTDIKIPIENLDGIERGDLSLLPSPVYYGLFARTYSQTLGIDYSRTIEAIKDELSAELKKGEKAKAIAMPEDLIELKKPEVRLSLFRTLIGKLIGGAVALVLVFLVYLLVDSVFFPNGLNRNNTSEMLKGVDADRINALAGFNWDVAQYKSPSEMKIDLIPRSESWSTVVADGDTVIFRRLLPGRPYSASAKYRLVVSIGVPEAVDVEINGRIVDLRDPVSQRVSRIEINQANLEAFINPSLENLPASGTVPLEQGALEPTAARAVSVTENVIPDTTASSNTDKDES